MRGENEATGAGLPKAGSPRQAEHLLRLLVRSVTDYAIFMLDTRGCVTTWNAGAERVKGYRAEEILGEHFSVFYRPEDKAKTEPELRDALAEGRFEDEGWRVRKDGTLFWANVIITPIFDEDGTHVGFGKVTRDLTERRRAEEDRVRLAEARAEINLRDTFLSIASHELKTPLGAVRLQIAALQLLLERGPQALDDVRERLQMTVRQIGRLNELIERLLDVTRLRTGRLALVIEDVDVGALVDGICRSLEVMAAQAGCDIRLHLPPGRIPARWDRLRIEQVLTNVLENAMKYGAGKPIDVNVTTIGNGVTISIADRGLGIPELEKSRIFEPFERGALPPGYGGLGLGLYLAQQIVRSHGGTIDVQSEPEVGATFVVSVPCFPAATAPAEERT